MATYRINSECGLMTDIVADSIDAAKDAYSRKHHYDFDAAPDIESSWYWIVCDDTGETVEECEAAA